ncbi:MAG: hypothetical protein E6212_03935, partial [Actinomyces sp.]|nr:hypothetical protein [Actinomyces sp.]
VVFGAWDPKAGAAGSLRDVLRDARMPHPTEVIGGVLAQEAAMQLRSFFLGCRSADEMPVVQAPVHEPDDIPAPLVVPYEEDEAPASARTHEQASEKAPRHEGVPAQLVTPDAPAAPVSAAAVPAAPAAPAIPVAPSHSAHTPSRHRGTQASPLPRRAGRPFSERVSGNADDPADIPAGESIAPAPQTPPSQPPYRSAAPVMPAVSPDTTHGPITRSVPRIRPVHVRPTATVSDGLYTPAQPGRPLAQPLRESAPRPPAPTPAPVADEPIPAPPVFPQRAQKRTSERPQRPLPQAFEPEPPTAAPLASPRTSPAPSPRVFSLTTTSRRL